MFTGIIQAIGELAASEQIGSDRRWRVRSGALPLASVNIGDSIAANGVCLTVAELHSDGYVADLSVETLTSTTLGVLPVGAHLNLEKALTLSTPLGGHLVSGHVDGVGEVVSRRADGRSIRFELQAPAELARYIARKGSVCVDGVSLTVNAVQGSRFQLNVVPHSLAQTIMTGYRAGTRVNIEVDLVARHLERLLLGDRAADPAPAGEGLTLEKLSRHGFLR